MFKIIADQNLRYSNLNLQCCFSFFQKIRTYIRTGIYNLCIYIYQFQFIVVILILLLVDNWTAEMKFKN